MTQLPPSFKVIAKSPGSWSDDAVLHLTELLEAHVHDKLEGIVETAPPSWLAHARAALKDVLEESGIDPCLYEGVLDGGGFFSVRVRSAIDRLADLVRP